MPEYSYNGWVASPTPSAIGIEPFWVFGESFPAGVKGGDVATVFRYLCTEFHHRVEPLVKNEWHSADDWGYYYRQNRNAGNLSCHSSGTAIDLNATRHPNGSAGTFSRAQVENIRRILAELEGVVKWGGDFSGTKDEMHFEICASAARVREVAHKIRTAGELTPVSPQENVVTEGQMQHLKEHMNWAVQNYIKPLQDQVVHLDGQIKMLRRDMRELGDEAGLAINNPTTLDDRIES